MKFSIKDLSSKYDQIRRKMWIWSHLLKKSLIENFIFCAVSIIYFIEPAGSPHWLKITLWNELGRQFQKYSIAV